MHVTESASSPVGIMLAVSPPNVLSCTDYTATDAGVDRLAGPPQETNEARRYGVQISLMA